MNIRFTIEEENIIAIYAEDSRERTIDNINSAMPYMDEDMRQLAAAAVNKLQAMTDSAPVFYRSSKIIFFPCFCAYRSVVYAPPKSRHTIAIK